MMQASDQRQATARVYLLRELAGIDPAAPTIKGVPRQRMELLTLTRRGSSG